MEDKVYQAGNTVKLECSFFDFDGITPFDPINIKVIIYDQFYNVLETLTDNIAKEDIGKYSRMYQTSQQPQYIYYEWYGEKDGYKAIKRNKLRTVFI